MTNEASPIARTKHGDLTIDQIAEMMPGMARLMVEISDRYWLLFYAAQGGKWELALHEFSELRKTMQMAGLVRPKYREPLEQFEVECLKPLEEAMGARDWSGFDASYRRAIDGANERHREFGYAYIEWQLPETPPPHLRLTQ